MSSTKGNTQRDEDDGPIYTPAPESDMHWMERDPKVKYNYFAQIGFKLLDAVAWPGEWFRANVVEPNRGPKYYWYHRKFARVLPIDECYADDDACFYEADLEYKRIKKVDRATLEILRMRKDSCYYYYENDSGLERSISDKCKDISDTFDREELNYHIKYGDLPYRSNVVHAYTKQKHRMIVERRLALKKQLSGDVEGQSS